MATLRSFIFLDQLQPQTMCCLGSWIRGSLPRRHMAAQIIEVAPGLDIEALTDIALEGSQCAGRRSRRRTPVRLPRDPFARRRRGQGLGRTRCWRRWARARPTPCSPKCWRRRSITRIDPGHAFLINRNKGGSMILAGETLFVLETEPAAYAILASNAAEKAANMKLVDYRIIGATGQALSLRHRIRSEGRGRRRRTGVGIVRHHETRDIGRTARPRARGAARSPRRARRPGAGTESVRIGSDANCRRSSAALPIPESSMRFEPAGCASRLARLPHRGIGAESRAADVLEGVVSEQRIAATGRQGHAASWGPLPC